MYPNLKAEVARRGISHEKLAKSCNMTTRAVNSWLNDDIEMKICTAVAIREKLFPELEYSYLFEFTPKES